MEPPAILNVVIITHLFYKFKKKKTLVINVSLNNKKKNGYTR